jgi:hypothetical protein
MDVFGRETCSGMIRNSRNRRIAKQQPREEIGDTHVTDGCAFDSEKEQVDLGFRNEFRGEQMNAVARASGENGGLVLLINICGNNDDGRGAERGKGNGEKKCIEG